MGNPSNWNKIKYDQIALDGVPLQLQRTILNLIQTSGVVITVEDNDDTEQTDVTITVGAAVPLAPVRWAYGQGADYYFPVNVETIALFDTTAGGIVAHLPASADTADGTPCTIKDAGLALGSNTLVADPSTGDAVEYPPGVVHSASAPVTFGDESLGISLRLMLDKTARIWRCMS